MDMYLYAMKSPVTRDKCQKKSKILPDLQNLFIIVFP
jgi:hypothetical protein